MAEMTEKQFEFTSELHKPPVDRDQTDFHYACAAASHDGISVICYEVTENNVTVQVIHQSHVETDPASGEGHQVQNRTTVVSARNIPRHKFRFCQPCISPSGKVTLFDGGHCRGPRPPMGATYVWKQGLNGVENTIKKLEFPEGHTRIEHSNTHVFNDDTGFISIIPNIVKAPADENVKHFKCDLQNGTAQLLEQIDQNTPPFIMKSRKDDQIVLFNNRRQFHILNGLQENPVLVPIGDTETNEKYANDDYPTGIKSKESPVVVTPNGNGINGVAVEDAGNHEELKGNIVIKTKEKDQKTTFHLIKDPSKGIEKTWDYESIYEDSVKFAISDDGKFLAISVADMTDKNYVDVYNLSNFTSLRLNPVELYSGFDYGSEERSLCEIGALHFTPGSTNLAVAVRTKSAFYVTFHEVICDTTNDQQTPKTRNIKYCMLQDNLIGWDRKIRPRYYDIQASQDFMIVAGSNIGAFIVPYRY